MCHCILSASPLRQFQSQIFYKIRKSPNHKGLSSICTFLFSAFGYKISAVKYRILVRFCQVLLALFLNFFSFFFGNSSHMLSTNSHRNFRLSTSSTRIIFFAPSYGGSISASGIIFTATGTGFTKSLSMRTNTLLRINILRHCIDFIYLIQTYFLPKQMSHQYCGFRLLLLH